MAADLNAVRDALAATVAAAVGEGVQVTTDPRATNLPCILIGVPGGSIEDGRTARVLFPVVILAPPPGGDAAVRWQLTQLSALLAAVRPLVDFRPENYDLGDRRVPAIVGFADRTIVYC